MKTAPSISVDGLIRQRFHDAFAGRFGFYVYVDIVCITTKSVATDLEFLKSTFNKLVLNFTWWVNRKDRFGKNIFEGGFLGLDNIGVFDRSAPLPTGGHLEQADGTAWMALFSQSMLELAIELGELGGSARGEILDLGFSHSSPVNVPRHRLQRPRLATVVADLRLELNPPSRRNERLVGHQGGDGQIVVFAGREVDYLDA